MAIFDIETDKHECPVCDSILVSFDGKRQICPSCGAREIETLRRRISRMVSRDAEMIIVYIDVAGTSTVECVTIHADNYEAIDNHTIKVDEVVIEFESPILNIEEE